MRSIAFSCAAFVVSGVVVSCAAAHGSEVGPRASASGGTSGQNGAVGVSAGNGGNAGFSLQIPPDSGSDGAPVEVDPNDACVTASVVGEHVPLDLYLMIDKSGSMRCRPDQPSCDIWANVADSRWGAVTAALEQFIAEPSSAGLGVGLGFFPLGEEKLSCIQQCDLANPSCDCYAACGCKAQDCACNVPGTKGCSCTNPGPIDAERCKPPNFDFPAAPVSPLPASAASLTQTIDDQLQGGGTPTYAALQGALDYASGWAKKHPARRMAVVFATDGEPAGCGPDNTIANAALAAKTALESAPSISTYVIGVGSRLASLNAIAEAGGTSAAYLVATPTDALGAFTQALTAIRGKAQSCDYALPDRNDLDFARVNVNVTIGGTATSQRIQQAATAAACAGSNGWFYDNPSAPSEITLCPKTCADMAAAEGSTLHVLMGCLTEPLNPR